MKARADVAKQRYDAAVQRARAAKLAWSQAASAVLSRDATAAAKATAALRELDESRAELLAARAEFERRRTH